MQFIMLKAIVERILWLNTFDKEVTRIIDKSTR